MPSTLLLLRLAKIVSVGALGLMATLIVLGNITDYSTNYYFVEHVMKMDTVFPGSAVQYRSIHAPAIFHAAYVFIILLEAFMSFCFLTGTWQMAKHLKKDAIVFHASKNWAVAGIITGILIWFVGFEVVGGEWFSMWQSASWNGLAAAERVLGFMAAVLILLHLKEQ